MSSGPHVNEQRDVLSRIGELGVVPVVSVGDAADAVPLAHALIEGGLPCVEFTLRTPAGLEAIREAAEIGGLLVGAGSVLTMEQATMAVDRGARFVVSPGFDAELVSHVRALGALPIPGVATASELQHAVRIGLEAVKFFPALQLGGIEMLRALKAPFPAARFIPTGGVGEADLAAYLAVDAVHAVGGSWVASRALVDARQWQEITRNCARARAIVADRATADGATSGRAASRAR